MKRVIGVLGVMLVVGMGSEGFADLGDTGADLIYTPVAPCRIIDTRVSGAGGPIPGNGTRDFVVVGATGFASQGGNPAGCGSIAAGGTANLVDGGVTRPFATDSPNAVL